MIIFLPIPLLLRLNIKPAQKAGVVCLFLLGLFTTICSILRLTQIHRVAFGDGNSTMLVLWGTIEFNVGVSLSTQRATNPHLTRTRISSPVFPTWRRSSKATSVISAPPMAANTMTVAIETTPWRIGPKTSDHTFNQVHLVPRSRSEPQARN